VFQNRAYLLLFLHRLRSLLTAEDLSAALRLYDPYFLKVRAFFAQHVLLPAMYRAGNHNIEEYLREQDRIEGEMRGILKDPLAIKLVVDELVSNKKVRQALLASGLNHFRPTSSGNWSWSSRVGAGASTGTGGMPLQRRKPFA
jgi:hypothetical protein